MDLYSWSWIFMILYIGAMAAFGWIASRRVQDADDFATARSSYGPWLLALAFASTAASGSTFLGVPGLAYTYGMSTLWIAFLYPLGIYLGVLICQRQVGRYGNNSGARSIPEYLGERYQSEVLRICAAVLSLLLLFYLAGQLVAGLVMFEIMLGLSPIWAMTITAAVLIGYVTMGGAHADIITDGAQGLLMVILAIAIAIFFFMGFGAGGLSNLLDSLNQQDAKLLESFNTSTPIAASTWSYVALVIAHIPLGLLPHIGNKLWALKSERSRNKFLILAFVFGMILPAISMGGILARGVLGGDLLTDGGANTALPAFFIELFPTWLAALLGVGVLAAIMSTADGLLISTSQVFANDIYRKSIAPRIHSELNEAQVENNVLKISRVVTVLTLLGSIALGWAIMDMNVTLLIWTGVGGFTAALMGPLVFGSLWDGITSKGAVAGFLGGVITFVLIHSKVISWLWPEGVLENIRLWFEFNAGSPYSAATMGGIVSIALCYFVSKNTEPLPADHMAKISG